MHDAVHRAREARRVAGEGRRKALEGAMAAHERAAAAARTTAAIARLQGEPAIARLHERAAHRHEARAAAIELRLGGRAPGPRPGAVHVHLGFSGVETRKAVCELLHGLGDWPAGRLVDRPGEGVRFEMRHHEGEACEAAVWERIRLALHDLSDPAHFVNLHTVRVGPP